MTKKFVIGKKDSAFAKAREKANKFSSLLGKDLLPFDPSKDGVTQSLISSYRTCPRKARLSMAGVYRTTEEGYALVFGTVFHEFLDIMYSKLRDSEISTLEDLIDNMPTTEATVIAHFAGKLNGDPASEHYAMALAVCSRAVIEYFRYWHKDFFGESKKTWLALEEEWKDKRGSILLRGKVDGVFKDAKDNVWLFETKTKGRFAEQSLAQMVERDLQVNLYVQAVEKKYGETMGCVYNIIRRPELRRGKSESADDFAQRCVDDIKARPDHYFVRLEVRLTTESKAEFATRFDHELKLFEEWMKQSPDLDAEYTHNCIGAFGPCKFLPLCSRTSTEGYQVKKAHHSELSQESEEAVE